ncbi:DUF1127 domain-containing protein [Arvimicrobium flavum]|nr:DUF1127 domain-containing protein [Mesorhizobium shangrilense]
MKLIRTFRDWRAYRATVAELGRLSDRQLFDLGINRGSIEMVARRAVR